MSARRAAFVAVLVVAGCGSDSPISPSGLGVRIKLGAAVVEFGAAFPVTVVRTFRKGTEPAVWDEAALAPLTVRLVESTTRDDGDLVEETRRFDGYAFRAGDVDVPAAHAKLRVNHAVDPASPGPAELPGEPLGVPLPRSVIVLGAAIALAGLALLVRAGQRRATPLEAAPLDAAPAPVPAHATALIRIRELRDDLTRDSFHVDASIVLREFVCDRFGVTAMQRTSEELAADPEIAGAAERALLAGVLTRCDLVKFALETPPSAERVRLLDDAEAFIRRAAETAS